MSIGLLLGAIYNLFAGRNIQVDIYLPSGLGIVYNHVAGPGFFMALLWLLNLICC